MSGVAFAVFPIVCLHMSSFGAGLLCPSAKLTVCQPLKLLILLIECSYLCCTLCQAITSSEIGEIRLNLPQARGYDQQELIQLYWCLLCFQSECCTGGAWGISVRLFPSHPLNLQVRNLRPGELWGQSWGYLRLVCQVVFNVSNPATSRVPEVCPWWDCLNVSVGAAIIPAKDVSEQI